VRFVADKVDLGQVFLPALPFYLVSITAPTFRTSHLDTSDRKMATFEHSNVVPCVAQHWTKEGFHVF
jgi:hypothetical protein